MLLDLTLTGHPVAVLGDGAATSRVRRRYAALGAHVHSLDTPARAETYASGVIALGATRPALIVDVTSGEPSWAGAVALLCGLAPALRDEPAHVRAGTVTLVGAGPGDPGLHTVAARAALAQADVVLLDRLADHDPRAELAELAPGARVIDVGKDPGHHRLAQPDIERLMVAEARGGAHVVRLKGGDPFVFGRGGEEVAAMAAAGVPVTVVPGVSSALAVPAAAGIPVTHRETSRAVTVLSGHDPVSPATATQLVGLDHTIVLLMGMATLPQTVAALRRAGLPGDTPAAVVQEGWTPRQRDLVTTLDALVEQVHAHGLSNPSVVVIGAVAALAHGSDKPTRSTTYDVPTTQARPAHDLETTR